MSSSWGFSAPAEFCSTTDRYQAAALARSAPRTSAVECPDRLRRAAIPARGRETETLVAGKTHASVPRFCRNDPMRRIEVAPRGEFGHRGSIAGRILPGNDPPVRPGSNRPERRAPGKRLSVMRDASSTSDTAGSHDAQFWPRRPRGRNSRSDVMDLGDRSSIKPTAPRLGNAYLCVAARGSIRAWTSATRSRDSTSFAQRAWLSRPRRRARSARACSSCSSW
jgi:hypothetical protein